MDTARSILTSTIQQVLTERGQAARVLNDDDTLSGTLGLDSLDLAVIVVRLEQQLGRDPFRNGRPLVSTFGELVALYDQHEAGS